MTSTKALIALTPTILSWLIVLWWGVLTSKASTAQTLPLLPTKLTVPARYAPFYRSTANLTVPDSLRLPKGFRASVFHYEFRLAQDCGGIPSCPLNTDGNSVL